MKIKLSSPSQASDQMTTAACAGSAKTRKVPSQAHPKCRVMSKQLMHRPERFRRLTQQKQKTDTETVPNVERCHNKTQQ